MPLNSVNANAGKAQSSLQNLNTTDSELQVTQQRINTGKKIASATEQLAPSGRCPRPDRLPACVRWAPRRTRCSAWSGRPYRCGPGRRRRAPPTCWAR
ncbi:hypothetical protein ACRAWD_15750 [Caulobacter segnis]